MGKMKTHKGTAKRIKKTKRGKFLRRYASQDHFNAKESGNKKRGKRTPVKVKRSSNKKLKALMPY